MASKLVSSVIRLGLLAFVFLFVFFPDKLHIEVNYQFKPLFDNLYIRIAKTMILLLILIEILRMFYYGIIKTPTLNKIVANVGTLATMLLIFGILLEVVFMYVSQSHEGALSKASQIWFARYWPPVTTEGYRDKPKTNVETKKKIVVIGDSFAAGHGLDNVEDRFSDQLEQKLVVEKVVVYNLGISGSDTRDEFKRLQKFPIQKADAIVLEYFPNDIAMAAADGKLSLAEFQPYNDIKNPLLTMLAMRFYFPNYIYWQFPHLPPASITNYVQKAYSDTTILNPHLRDLKLIIDHAKAQNSKLYVVMIPFLNNIEKSNEYTQPVEDFFKANHIPVVKLADHLADIDPKNRSVGKNDGHASAAVNHRIADLLYELIKKDI